MLGKTDTSYDWNSHHFFAAEPNSLPFLVFIDFVDFGREFHKAGLDSDIAGYKK